MRMGGTRSRFRCREVDALIVGALIALYERAVGFYASLVNINAYHQPGVEAGKKAAARILALQGKVRAALDAAKGAPKTRGATRGRYAVRPRRRFPCVESFGSKCVKY